MTVLSGFGFFEEAREILCTKIGKWRWQNALCAFAFLKLLCKHCPGMKSAYNSKSSTHFRSCFPSISHSLQIYTYLIVCIISLQSWILARLFIHLIVFVSSPSFCLTYSFISKNHPQRWKTFKCEMYERTTQINFFSWLFELHLYWA